MPTLLQNPSPFTDVNKVKFFSRGLNLHSGIERVDATRSIPETWASHSMRNIQESQGDDDDDKHDDNHDDDNDYDDDKHDDNHE